MHKSKILKQKHECVALKMSNKNYFIKLKDQKTVRKRLTLISKAYTCETLRESFYVVNRKGNRES